MDAQNLLEIQSLSNFDPNNLNKIYKLDLMNKFMNAKTANPHLNQEQLCRMIGTSPSTIKRIRMDLNIKSPYRYDVSLKNKQPKKKETPKQITKRRRKENVGYGATAVDLEDKPFNAEDFIGK